MPLGQPSCKGIWAADSVSSDNETWKPSDGRSNSEECVFGKQVTYTRGKPTSECFNGEQFEPPSRLRRVPPRMHDREGRGEGHLTATDDREHHQRRQLPLTATITTSDANYH